MWNISIIVEIIIYFSFYFFYHIPSGSEVFIHLVFGSMTFKLFLQASQNKLLEFQVISPSRTVVTESSLSASFLTHVISVLFTYFLWGWHKGFVMTTPIPLLSRSYFTTTMGIFLGSLFHFKINFSPFCFSHPISLLVTMMALFYWRWNHTRKSTFVQPIFQM